MGETQIARNRAYSTQHYDTCLRLMKHADHILLHFTDLSGLLKGRTVPAEEAERTLKEGVGFDGSSITGGVRIQDSDMIMKPDPATFAVCPYYFYNKSVVSFICNMQRPDGERFESDPRYICQKTVEKAEKEGYKPTAAAELEFYLVQKTDEGRVDPVENHLIDKHRYFDIAPGRDITQTYRLDLSHALSSLGITVEREQHEVGAAQNEITFRHSDPTITSDNIMQYKFAAKGVATNRYNWVATFMPKPWPERPGNGMHIHLSLSSTENDGNIFYDPEGYAQLSQKSLYFIGGILQHARALCAIVAPTANSYKRLVPGYEAPIYIAWSRRNRSALIRIPEYFRDQEKEARIEFRCPDPSCNPYLAFAAIVQAGLEGIRKKTSPGEPVEKNIYHLTPSQRKELGVGVLPTTLEEALEELESDDFCVKALGKETAQNYLKLKRQEWKEYEPHQPTNKTEVTQWEIKKYLYA
ncbi:type I glutamate--ammonia ligase [Candidatus Bathyarchaeota archaeon]|nr:type I glutamate--ammonia ligase [Candidatus Bathyarchaeota archaeon]